MKSKRVRDVAVRLAAAFAILGAMQAASLLIVNRSSSQREEQAAVASIVANNIISVDRYKGSSYLAVVALATEDWKLLLEQRQAAIDLARHFEHSMKVLLEGGEVTIGGTVFRVAALSDQAERAAATAAVGLWRTATEHQVKMLRSRDRRIGDNDEIGRFRTAALTAVAKLESLRELTTGRGKSLEARVALVERGLPIAATLLVIVLAVVVHRRMVRPLDRAIWDLDRAKAALEGTVRKLASAQAELLQASRMAGMAEVASSVLHNVGNVLNSIGVGAQTAGARLHDTVLTRLDRAFALIDEHQPDLGSFLSENEKGKKLIPYIRSVTAQARADQLAVAGELEHVREKIEHVMVIVAKQQSYARPSTLTEACSMKEVVQDSVSMCTASFTKHEIDVECAVEVEPLIQADRHKVMQILVNLLRNAKDALRSLPRADKKITISGSLQGGEVVVRVSDNGVGVPAELQPQLFTHGFTTKPDGHGFGLHNSCLLAQQMGGALTCQSQGADQGATFELRFPAEVATIPDQRGAA